MQQPASEQQLIVQAQRGDEEAVTLLYENYVDAVFEHISYRVASKTTAEDLTSEVFLRMVRGLASYKDQGIPFRAWLFRIATNLIVDYYRQQKKDNAVPLLEDQKSDDTDPFDRLAKGEEQLRLFLAIRALPEAYQNLLILRFVDDLPHTEIAKILDKSVDSLRSMQYRALKALGEQFAIVDDKRNLVQGEE